MMVDPLSGPLDHGLDEAEVAAIVARATAKLPRGRMTAEEFARSREELMQTDPDYARVVNAYKAAEAERQRLLAEAQAPILRDLQALGIDVKSVWSLDYSERPYPEALSVLMQHLERGGYPDRITEGLGRALGVKSALQYWDRLKALYLNPRSRGEEDGVAAALSMIATKKQLPDLISFLDLDDRGSTRVYFLGRIKRLGGEEGLQILERLRDHPQLGKEASWLLRPPRKRS